MPWLTNHIKRRPVAGFILITFVISYLIGIPVNILISVALPTVKDILSIYAPIFLIGTAPAISAIIITSIVKGQAKVKSLFTSLLPTSKTWFYLIMIPLVSFAFMGLSLLVLGVNMNTLVKLVNNTWPYIFLHLAAQFFIVGIGEEIGWRGWLFPQLLREHSIMKSTLITAIIWTAWHLPKLVFQPAIAPFMILMFIGASIIMAWVWLKSKANIGLIAMIHAAVNAPFFYLEQQAEVYQISPDLITHAWSIWSIIFFLIGLVVVAFHYKKWFTPYTIVKVA